MAPTYTSFLDIVSSCDKFRTGDLPDDIYTLYLPNDERPHGLMRRSIVQRMPWTSDFQITASTLEVRLIVGKESQENISTVVNQAFANVINTAIEKDSFEMLHQMHSEPYRIIGANYPCNVERFAHALFGIAARGAHMTVYVKSEEGILVWVPRRAAHLFTYPGKLDTTVAGGVKAHDSPVECIIAEAMEEASLPKHLVRDKIRPAGTLTYVSLYSSPTLKEVDLISPEVLYIFDLEVSTDVILRPNDDEVESFELMNVDTIMLAMRQSLFKTNSAVVMMDFFIRHGIITPENEPDYVEIVSRIHRRLPIATTASR
jgi:isopentenyldiphosphate isomerase